MRLPQQRRQAQQALDLVRAEQALAFVAIEVNGLHRARRGRVQQGEALGQALALVDVVAPARHGQLVGAAVQHRHLARGAPRHAVGQAHHRIGAPVAAAVDREALGHHVAAVAFVGMARAAFDEFGCVAPEVDEREVLHRHHGVDGAEQARGAGRRARAVEQGRDGGGAQRLAGRKGIEGPDGGHASILETRPPRAPAG